MKFIHIADVHLGAVPDRDYPWGAEREKEIWETFAGIIETVKQEKTDLLLIAGDFFHGQPLMRELKETAYYFSQIPDTQIVLTAGNHDHLRKDSNYLGFPWPENVTCLWSGHIQSCYLEKLNTYVYGLSYKERENREPVYNQTFPGNRINFRTEHPDAFHILLAHGGDEKHIPIHFSQLAGADFDYIALGHIHKPEILVPGKMAYAGSPEPIDKNETGPHGYVKGTIGETNRSGRAYEKSIGERADGTWQFDFSDYTGKNSTEIVFVPASKREYKNLVLHVNPHSTKSGLLDQAAKFIRENGNSHIYRISLEGFRDPDMIFTNLDFSSVGNVIEVLDETEPAYDLEQMKRKYAGTVIGGFLEKFPLDVPELMTEVQKKALYYGLQALLEAQK